MATNDPALLDRILSFDIDGGPATLGFDRRLARECNWPLAYARRVIAEYRRFLYLSMTAGHPVTPSDEVDQAWHLHLVYTRSYWERLCRDVLPRPLHHEPTRGGQSENAKFDDWYARTLESYAAAFGAAPPPDVWPPAPKRFDARRRFERVRKADCWIIRKPRVRSVLPVAALVALAPLAAGAGLLAAGEGGIACVLFALVAGVVLCVGLFARTANAAGPARRKDGGDRGSSCGGGGGCGTSPGGLFHGGAWGASAGSVTGPADATPTPDGSPRVPPPGRLDVHDVEGGETGDGGASDGGGGGDGGGGDGGGGCGGGGCGGGCGS